MAREATARQFDVDEDSVVLKRLTHTGSYDRGTITFKAKKGKLISLDKLHESLWATRLSGGTKSGLLRLDVTAIGQVVTTGEETILRVTGSKEHFVLADDPKAKPKDGQKTVYQKMLAATAGGQTVRSVTGRLDGWSGLWPKVLRKLPPQPRRILVTGYTVVNEK